MSDYIKREDAINALYEECNKDQSLSCPYQFFDGIERIPAADVRENVHGEWIDCDVNESGLEDTVSLLCNNCGNYTEFALVGTPKEVMDTMRFCPHCGSMNGGNEK